MVFYGFCLKYSRIVFWSCVFFPFLEAEKVTDIIFSMLTNTDFVLLTLSVVSMNPSHFVNFRMALSIILLRKKHITTGVTW